MKNKSSVQAAGFILLYELENGTNLEGSQNVIQVPGID